MHTHHSRRDFGRPMSFKLPPHHNRNRIGNVHFKTYFEFFFPPALFAVVVGWLYPTVVRLFRISFRTNGKYYQPITSLTIFLCLCVCRPERYIKYLCLFKNVEMSGNQMMEMVDCKAFDLIENRS